MKRLFVVLVVGTALTVGITSSALAASNPSGSGQPSTSCETFTTRPGAAMTAKGSAFNPDGTAGLHYAGNDGTQSLAHAQSSAAVSQYDVACFQQTSHG